MLKLPRRKRSPAATNQENANDVATIVNDETAAGARKAVETKVVLCVSGMTCSACAVSVENSIKHLPGILDAAIDFLNDRAQIRYLPNLIDVSRSLFYSFWSLILTPLEYLFSRVYQLCFERLLHPFRFSSLIWGWN